MGVLLGRQVSSSGLQPGDIAFDVTDPNQRTYTLNRDIDAGYEFVVLNGFWLQPGRDYIFISRDVTISNDILLVIGDSIYVKYFY